MSETESQAGDPSEHESQSVEKSSVTGHEVTQLVAPLRRISDYQLIRKIGRGGMGEVYEALHVRLKKRVAVKLLPEGRVPETGILRRFFREMEAAGKLTHPQIVQATDAGDVDGVPYLVMELVDGADLGHVVRQFGPLPPIAALEAIEQAALGLEHIHHHGLVHRDVKPSNLLMDRQAVVKVGDLGLAQLNHPPSQSDDLTSSDLLVGTIDYMAPEQAECPKLVDHRADIYSLGCCLYNLMTAQTVFGSTSRIERLVAHRTQLPPLISEYCPTSVPQSLERLFHRMLEKRPSHRPDSMHEVLAEIAECKQELQRQFARQDTGDLTIGPQRFSPTAGLQEVAGIVFSIPGRVAEHNAKSTMIAAPRARSRRFRALTLTGVVLALFFATAAISYFSQSRLRPGNVDLPSTGSQKPSSTSQPYRGPSTGVELGATVPGITVIRSAHIGPVFALDFSPDGKLLFSTGNDGAARAWDLSSRKSLGEISDSKMEIMIGITALPTIPLVVAASYSGRAYVWNWKEGKTEQIFDRALGHVEGVARAGGTKVVTSGVDDALYLWDALSGTVIAKLPNQHQGGVRALAVDPSHRYLVSGDYEGNLTLWDLEQKTHIDTLTIDPKKIAIWGVDWAPNANHIAICGIGSSSEGNAATGLLLIYDPLRREVIQRFTADGRKINSVRFSRNGRMLYSVADDFRAWSLPGGELLQKQVLPGGELFGLAESVDGAIVAVGSSDGTIHLIPAGDISGPK